MLLFCHYGFLAALIKFLPVLFPGKMAFKWHSATPYGKKHAVVNSVWSLGHRAVSAQWESACLHIDACRMAAMTKNILFTAPWKRHGRAGKMCWCPTAEIMS